MGTNDADPMEVKPEPVPDTSSAPQWAQDLKRTIEELPARLSASVTDDDKDSIAEKVHGLFERSGAFEREEVKPDNKEGDVNPPDDPGTETPPKKQGGLAKFASRFAGEDGK